MCMCLNCLIMLWCLSVYEGGMDRQVGGRVVEVLPTVWKAAQAD